MTFLAAKYIMCVAKFRTYVHTSSPKQMATFSKSFIHKNIRKLCHFGHNPNNTELGVLKSTNLSEFKNV